MRVRYSECVRSCVCVRACMRVCMHSYVCECVCQALTAANVAHSLTLVEIEWSIECQHRSMELTVLPEICR